LKAIKEERSQESKKAANQASNLAKVIDNTFYVVGFFLLKSKDSSLKNKLDKNISN